MILLDEPLSALDRKLRETLQIELRQMLRDAGMTAIFVTHDQEEALVMSDRIAVMNHGCIEQLDVPEQIYARPRTPFALNFVGLSSQWTGRISKIAGDTLTVETACGPITAPASPGLCAGASVLVGVRPERITALPETAIETAAGQNRVTLPVSDIVYRGANRLVYFKAPDGAPGSLVAELPAHLGAAPATGDRLALSWPVADTLVFALETAAEAA